MQLPELPPEICVECRNSTPDHWIHDLFNYCPHSRTAVIRRRLDPSWTIRKNVSPRAAEKHLLGAIAKFKKLAAEQGQTPEDWDAVVQRVRDKDAKERR